MAKADNGTKRKSSLAHHEAPQPTKTTRYSTGANVRDAARDEVGSSSMDLSSGTNSVAGSRRSSMSVNKDAVNIGAFKGDTYKTAGTFQPSGRPAPLHPVNQMPQTRPESSGGVTAKVQSLLADFSNKMDTKIEKAVQPLASAQVAVQTELAALSGEINSVGTKFDKALVEQSARGDAELKSMLAGVMNATSASVTTACTGVITTVTAQLESQQESTEESAAALRSELSQAKAEAATAVASAAEILTANAAALKQELEQNIASSAEAVKQEMTSQISQTSTALEARVASNLQTAKDELKSDVVEKVSALSAVMQSTFEEWRGVVDSKMSMIIQTNKDIIAIKEQITALQEQAAQSEFDHIDIRDSFIQALVGLKGHLLANTAEFIAYKEDYSETDKQRLELHLEVKMYDEISEFVAQFAPNFNDAVVELTQVAKENLDRLTNHDAAIETAAVLYDLTAQGQLERSEYSDEEGGESEAELAFADSLQVTDITGESAYHADSE